MLTRRSRRLADQRAWLNLQRAEASPLSPQQIDPIAYGGHPSNRHQPFALSLIPFDLNKSHEVPDQMITPKLVDTRKSGA